MKNSSLIVVHIFAVWLCLCLSGCKTSHTISRAELHRTTEHVSKTDSLATHTAVTDSTYHNTSVTDSTVITHIIETIITNTVDANGNIIDTKLETNRTTNRDHNRIVNDQTSNTRAEQTDTDSKSNLINVIEQVDSVNNNEVIQHETVKIRPWYEIILESLFRAFSVLCVLAVVATCLYLSYKYIKGN